MSHLTSIPGESALWHARYLVYRDLGPTRRLLTAFARCYDGTRQPADVPVSWYDAADRWHWRERAREWDRTQADERDRLTAESATTDKRERVALLRATRGKVITALNETGPQDDGFGRIVAEVATITDQLRKESED